MSHSITPKAISQYGLAKRQNEKLALSLKRIGDSRWTNVMQCVRRVDVEWCPVCGKAHINAVWCCKHRLCPVCALRRSRKVGRQAIEAFKYMVTQGQMNNVKMCLLTLTQKNVTADLLGEEIDRLLIALGKIRNHRLIRNYVVGAARNIEITYNAETYTFHPHIHMIVFIDNNAPIDMANSRYWRDLWRQVMSLDYEPICDIREINDERGAICEVSKYCIKPSSIFAIDLEDAEMDAAIWAISSALSGRHLISYTGIWRKARSALKQVEPDDDLEHDDLSDVCGCGAELLKAVFEWDGLRYIAAKNAE